MTTPRNSAILAALVLRGTLSVAVGVVAIAWPLITVRAFVFLFATYLFIGAAIEMCLIPRAHAIRLIASRLLLALVDIAAGVAALVWPGITTSVLVTLVAVWAFVAGIGQLALTLGGGKGVGERVLLGLGGFASIAVGVVFIIDRNIAAVTLARVYGSFSIGAGLILFVLAARLRNGDLVLASRRHPGRPPWTTQS
jgi:uncharacterized membrane protein HdeD (DUF308 family)